MIKSIQKIVLILIVFAYSINCSTVSASSLNDFSKCSGIIRIYSGLSESDYSSQVEKFYKIKEACGFLVYNSNDSSAYIISSYNQVVISNEEKKIFLKKEKIKNDSSNFSEQVRIVVDSDVTEVVDIYAKSEEQNFCVLSTSKGINKKDAFALGDSDSVMNSDKVYVLGLSQGNNENVIVKSGTITSDSDSSKDYIIHDAGIDISNIGGPLLNSSGIVVGINSFSNDGYSYSLSINRIKKILDNEGIKYNSNSRNTKYEQLQNLYNECNKLYLSKEYKKESLTDLENVIKKYESIFNAKDVDESEIEQYIDEFNVAKSKLVKKTPKTLIMIIVMGIINLLLAIWLILLIVYNIKQSKNRIKLNNSINTYNNYEQTQLLQSKLIIKHVRNNRTIAINKNEFVFGKSTEFCDYAISDNKTISRKHAIIRIINGKYFVFDLDSSNGTFLNGKRVYSNGKEIKKGDTLTLSNERFVCE